MKRIIDYIKEKDKRLLSPIWGGRKEFNFLCMHHLEWADALGFEVYQATPMLKLVKEDSLRDEQHLDDVIEKRYFKYLYFDKEIAELKTMLKTYSTPCGGGCFGPLTIVSGIYGIEKLLRDIVKKPQVIHKFVRYVTDYMIELAQKEKEAGNQFFWIAEPLASVLAPKKFWEFSGKYLKEIFDASEVPGFLHVCGQTINHTNYMVDTGAQVLSIDYMTDIGKCISMVPEDVVILGNISPILLRTGTTEEVREECNRILEICKEYDNFIMGTGCSIIEGTPDENMEEIFKVVEEFPYHGNM